MAEITASLVKELRDKTNAGMMECKNALKETDGDVDAAIKFLRERGAIKAAKKADREAKEGVVTAQMGDNLNAQEYYLKAIELDSNLEAPYLNLVALIPLPPLF